MACKASPEVLRLREAVIEAARQGLRSTRRNFRNPEYVKDPNYDMLMRVVGPCRAMAEQVERGEIVVETAMKGFLDEEARLSGVRHSAFRALLPPSWEALPTSSQLVHFEKAFAKVDRDPAAMEPGERYEMECWLTEVCEAFGGEQDGYRAQRLLEEMDG